MREDARGNATRRRRGDAPGSTAADFEGAGVWLPGDEHARVVGVFPDDELTATFESPLEPFGTAVVPVGGAQ